MNIRSTIPERVAAGEGLQNRHDPGWWRGIDLATLDLRSAYLCLRGQRCTITHPAWQPPYIRDLTWLAAEEGVAPGGMDEFAAQHGFVPSPRSRDREEEWALLEAEWRVRIKKLQTAEGSPQAG